MREVSRREPPGAADEHRAGVPAGVRAWLGAGLTGEFAALRGRGGPGPEHVASAQHLAWPSSRTSGPRPSPGEVQRNVIAEHVLGLPKEVRP
ncbi:hypothetical protein [Streptomyces cahuitamycinicus]|uniref:Uncharacterized protein n=1 Tax=Streptomyces cahuitamycinicus TaxID=2070367 RepID=A0A2N8TYJ4_9ACTN|nr:hypothetical protein [Streptomyces cahuitamycinicus]PNG24097.1 hypothetical protein C1J00_00180 [Streptomyces cahuitamycinicus]